MPFPTECSSQDVSLGHGGLEELMRQPPSNPVYREFGFEYSFSIGILKLHWTLSRKMREIDDGDIWKQVGV